MSPFAEKLVFVGIGIVITWFWRQVNARKEASDKNEASIAKLKDRILELEKQSASLSQTVQPLSTAFQSILVKELTHFHTPVMDALMVKLMPFTLTDAEEIELIAALKQRTQDMSEEISDSERDAAVMLPLVMKRVRHETVAMIELTLVLLPRAA